MDLGILSDLRLMVIYIDSSSEFQSVLSSMKIEFDAFCLRMRIFVQSKAKCFCSQHTEAKLSNMFYFQEFMPRMTECSQTSHHTQALLQAKCHAWGRPAKCSSVGLALDIIQYNKNSFSNSLWDPKNVRITKNSNDKDSIFKSFF